MKRSEITISVNFGCTNDPKINVKTIFDMNFPILLCHDCMYMDFEVKIRRKTFGGYFWKSVCGVCKLRTREIRFSLMIFSGMYLSFTYHRH